MPSDFSLRPLRRLAAGAVLAALGTLALLAPGSALAAAKTPTHGKPWKRGATLKVYSELPARYDQSIAEAFRQYATAGARVKFKRVSRRAGAQVVLKLDNIRTSGLATQGRPRSGKAVVRISRTWDVAARNDGPYMAAYLITHELGHVLGLDHPDTNKKLCTVMNAAFMTVCKLPEQTHDTWVCGLLQPVDHKALTKLYGGRAKGRRPWLCPLPGPKPLTDRVEGASVEVVAGSDAVAARVRWTPVAGKRMLVERRDSTCAAITSELPVKTMADSDAMNTVDATLGVAEDPLPAEQPTAACYSLTLVDPASEARSETVHVDAVLTPPAPPGQG